jgi:hypothetical protein
MYATTRLGVATTTPTEALDVSGNIKATNIYSTTRLGVATSNPTEVLDVVGNIKASSNVYATTRLGVATTTPTEALHVLGNIKATNVYSTTRLGVATSNPAEVLDVVGNIKASSNVYATVRLGVATTTPTEALDVAGSIKASANVFFMNRVGIATSNPSCALQVNATDAIAMPVGTTAQRPAAPVTGQIRYNSTLGAFEGYGSTTWGSLGGSSGGGGTQSPNTQTNISALDTGAIVFVSSNLEVARFQRSGAAGFLGIGTNNPIEMLHVGSGKIAASSNQILGYTGDTALVPAYSWIDDSNTGFYHPVADSIGFVTNGIERARMNATGNLGINTISPNYALEVNGTIYASGDILAFSDARCKTNVTPMNAQNTLSNLCGLQGYVYTRTDFVNLNVPEDKTYMGLIAQEVKDIFPEAVTYDDVNDKYGVSYGSLVPALIEAVKVLTTKISSMQEDIINLRNSIGSS